MTRLRRWTASHPVVLTGVALIAAQLGFRGWLLSHAWFQQDDFVFWQRALSSDLDIEYLFTGHVGHFMPAGFLLTWVNNQIDPLLFALPATEMLVMQAMASVACLVLLVHMFGARWGIMPPLAIFLFSPISLPAATWWAAGINQLPLLIVFFVGLHTHVSYLRTRRMRYAWWTMGWTAVGLLFTEKTLVMFEVYAIIALAYFATGHLADRIRHIWHNYRNGVIVYSLVVLGFVPYYYFAYLNFDASEVAEIPLSGLALNMVVKGYATGIIGGPLEWWSIGVFNAIAAPSDLLIFFSWAAIAGVLFAIARTRQRSKRAWLLVVAVLGTNVLLVATGRSFVVGALIGLEYRYQTEVVAATAVALALAWLPLIGAVESAEQTGKHPLVDSRPFWTGALALMILASALSSYRFMGKEHRTQSPEVYFANFEQSLPFDGNTVPMIDRAVPEKIWSPISFPTNLYSRMFMPWAEHLNFVSVAHDAVSVVDDRGNIRPVVIDPLRRHDPNIRSDQQSGCLARVGDTTREINLDGPVIGFGWWIRLSYLAQERSRLIVEFADQEYEVATEPGAHAIYMQADGNYDSISLTGVDDGRKICIDDVVLGVPLAAELP